MDNLSKRLKGFETRVRLVRSWRGMAMGVCVGAGASAIWALLDLRGVFYTEWSWMGFLVAGSAMVGALAGLLMKVPTSALVASIDRRANLDDRLTTARERVDGGDVFDEALRADAEARVAGLTPSRVFPLKVGRWQGGAVALCAAAAAIFLLGNTPIMLSDDQKQTRADLKKQGEAVQRITKQSFETPEAKQEMSDAEKRLADELRKYERDLEKSHLTREEAMQKGNELEQKADELAKQAQTQAQQSLEQAQSLRQNMEKSALQKAGMGEMNPSLAQMTDSQRKDAMSQAKAEASKLQKQLDEIQRKIDELNKKLADPHLSDQERKSLEAQKKGLENQADKVKQSQKQNQALQKMIELSAEAKKVFEKMMQDPLYKKLMEIQQKLAEKMQQQGQNGEQEPPLTDEERKQIKEQLEELAKQLKDDKAMQDYLKKLIEAAEHANQLGRCRKAGFGLGGTPLNLGNSGNSGSSQSQAPPGPGAPTEDIWQGDNHHVYKLDKAAENKGTTTETTITGQARPATGPQAYVEIKAPTGVGDRSSVPYTNVLPSYKKKAESALDRQQIPKQHQKRVKEYFDSLTGAPKN